MLQTWPNTELVIVDDADDRSFSDVPDIPGVRYHLLERRRTVGEKRNIAVERSGGEVIVHWDDDDSYAPERIEKQVLTLLRKSVDLVGYCSMVFEDIDSGEKFLYRSSPNHPIGVSLCYWKRTWEARKFLAINVEEDAAFADGRKSFVCECPAGLIVARIHGDNTSDKRSRARSNPAQWQRVA